MSVLAGRELEVAVVDAALTDVRAGRGGLIVVTGEPGIGKSRLAQEAVSRAESADIRTARGYAVDDPGAPPLWPWRRVGRDLEGVGQLLADPAGVGSDAAARFGLFEAVAAALAAAGDSDGLLVVLEDMHCADPPSIQLVRHLAADLRSRPVLLLLTARDRQVEPAWSAALPDLLRGSGTRSVVLSGLSGPAIATWLRSTPERADWAPYAEQLRLRGNGNPLYLDLLTADPPGIDGRRVLDRAVTQRPDLRAVVMASVASLSPDCRFTVEAASLLGERISPALLAEVSSASMTETAARLMEAIGAGVLRDTDSGPVFTHALVRDSVANDIPLDRRGELHRACALALERPDTAASAGFIAEHWRLAAGPEAASRCLFWSRRAAGVAAAGFATERAVTYAQLALQQADSLDLPMAELAELTVELAERQMAAGDLRAALGSCQQAADRADTAGRPDLLAGAALVISGVGDVEAFRVVGRLGSRALAILPATEGVLRARLLAQQAIISAETGGGPRAAELAATALASAVESGDRRAELEALAARHYSITLPETVDEREQLARRAIQLASSSAEPMAALWGHLWLIEVYLQRGELDRIDDELSEIELIAVRRRFPPARWHDLRIRAARAELRGDFDLALRLNDESLELATRMGDFSMVGVASAFTIVLAAVRGDRSLLGDDIVEMFRYGPPMPLLRGLFGTLLVLLGHRAEAAAILDELRFVIDELPVGPRWAGTLMTIGVTATLLEDADVADRVYQLLLHTAGSNNGDGSGTLFASGSNARALGDLALVAGRVDDAVGLYADAVIANIRLGAQPFVALGRFGWARALRLRAMDPTLAAKRSPGDLRLAADLARQAAADFRRLDMPGPLRSADELLTRLAADARHQSPLTTRESEIAGLIAEELSNKEIAARLVVSERTVESHVRNILAKLDLGRRAEIARWVRR